MRLSLFGLLSGGVAVLLAGCQASRQQPQMDVLGTTPTFQLTDQTGASFSSQALAGRVTLLDFIYTHCTDACPLLSANFPEAERKLSADNFRSAS